jgi:glycosyltransferase involved in cell wall biosynthesis
MTSSIFEEYYSSRPFADRFARDPADAIEVIIPVIHTNELWRANLNSIYREIPVRRLLISDGGCKDDSIDIVRGFPRVEVLDHTRYVSLGYSLRKLIEAVESEWFAYLHSDVYLPPGWFDAMKAHQKEYDWFGCPQRITALVEYPNVDVLGGEIRPHAGSQMGRKAAFMPGLPEIDDDYVYRQEDFVLRNLVEKHGFKSGNVEDIFHFHQVMHKFSPWARKLSSVSIKVEWTREEEVRASMMQIKGIVKYLEPSPALVAEVEIHLRRLLALNAITQAEFDQWVLQTKPAWKEWIKPWRIYAMSALESARAGSKRLLKSVLKT